MKIKIDEDKECIQILDKQGRTRILILVDGPCIDLLDENGLSRLSLSLQDGNGSVCFFDENTSQQITAGIDEKGDPIIYAFSQKKDTVAMLRVNQGKFQFLTDTQGEEKDRPHKGDKKCFEKP